jgi:hypothetical protein
MKKIIIASAILLGFAFFIFQITFMLGAGTTGRILLYNYSQRKTVVESNLMQVINKDSIYTVPEHWNDYELGTDSINDIYVSFNANPREIYQLNFIGPPSVWNERTCVLGFVGLFDGKLWNFEKDLDNAEKERVIKRLEMEILQKMRFRFKSVED